MNHELRELAGRWLSCGVLVVAMFAIVLCVVVPLGAIPALTGYYEFDQAGYTDMIHTLLGSDASSTYTVAAVSDADAVKALGLDPQKIANDLAAIEYVKKTKGVTIDLGIMVAIAEGEGWGSCKDGLSAAARSLPGTREAAVWLLNHMKEYDIRNLDEYAREMISADYLNYTAHCGAGEFGSGIWPPTGKQICIEDMSKITDDKDLAGCDFFSLKGRSYSKAIWLADIGYNSSLTEADKVSKLWGWNHVLSYRLQLVARAASINVGTAMVQLVPVIRQDAPTTFVFGDDARTMLIDYLEQFDLMPPNLISTEVVENPENSTPPTGDGLKPGSLSLPLRKGYRGVTTWPNPAHVAYDFGCDLGSPVLAAADGVIVIPKRAGWRYDQFGWGNSVWIDHGGGYFTHYAHLQVPSTVTGAVKRGQEIGLCGSTGRSDGPHVHFEVTKLHPDQYVVWNDPRALLDPTIYLKVRTSGQ